MDTPTHCNKCLNALQPSWNFCPQCGNHIQNVSLSTTWQKQLIIYSVSFFLAPFGLHWGMQYLRQPTSKEKIIGGISVVLTILAVLIGAYYLYYTINSTYSSLDNTLGL